MIYIIYLLDVPIYLDNREECVANLYPLHT